MNNLFRELLKDKEKLSVHIRETQTVKHFVYGCFNIPTNEDLETWVKYKDAFMSLLGLEKKDFMFLLNNSFVCEVLLILMKEHFPLIEISEAVGGDPSVKLRFSIMRDGYFFHQLEAGDRYWYFKRLVEAMVSEHQHQLTQDERLSDKTLGYEGKTRLIESSSEDNHKKKIIHLEFKSRWDFLESIELYQVDGVGEKSNIYTSLDEARAAVKEKQQ